MSSTPTLTLTGCCANRVRLSHDLSAASLSTQKRHTQLSQVLTGNGACTQLKHHAPLGTRSVTTLISLTTWCARRHVPTDARTKVIISVHVIRAQHFYSMCVSGSLQTNGHTNLCVCVIVLSDHVDRTHTLLRRARVCVCLHTRFPYAPGVCGSVCVVEK